MMSMHKSLENEICDDFVPGLSYQNDYVVFIPIVTHFPFLSDLSLDFFDEPSFPILPPLKRP